MVHNEQFGETRLQQPSSIDMIVEGLRGKFGEGASDVASGQIRSASPETLGVWVEVAARLDQTDHTDGFPQ